MNRKRLPTNNTEDFKSRIKRFLFNVFPTYWGTGARAIFLSTDFKEMGKRLAQMIINRERFLIENPNDLIIRNSL